jgi:chemotaxis protein CheD
MDIEVPIGEIRVAKSEDRLIASGIGSCLVITFYDSKQRIGALAHTMLPARRLSFDEYDRGDNRRDASHQTLDTRYADTAIDEMLRRIESHGAMRQNLEAKLIGGANMFRAFTSKIGEDNISFARKKLEKAGIAIVGECVGGSQGRSVEFSIASGNITVKTKF